MRFNLLQLLFAILLVPLTAALQTIYLAYIGSSGLYVFLGVFPFQPLIAGHVLHHRRGRSFHTCPIDAF